ncbi:microfibril-associated glycoprotein 4-like [Saccostrea cucullata]|uniref:microfibril-associated glycoprotein 4-like n=1 Tax=Saccostrea cuccullata TaxID=36930 RepID=UPI002ED3EE72
MAMVWAAFFLVAILRTSSQYINVNEDDGCPGNTEAMVQIERLQTTQSNILESVDSLRQTVERLDKEVTNINEDVQIVKKGLKLKTNCWDLFSTGHKQSEEYLIEPFGNESQVNVFCDMVTEGGGWTAIQKRSSGLESFNRTWAEYKKGFGNVSDSYWIGNDVIHQLTKGNNSSLYVSITLKNGTTLYELYHEFSVSDESDNYRLYLGGPASGTLGDSMKNHNKMPFSTLDRDNDNYYTNCVGAHGGGWWFNSCPSAFLNGQWSSESRVRPWSPTVTDGREIKGTLMMIKPQ